MATEARADRKALTRDAVVEAALALADAGGLEAVSFRRVAAALGVTPMALYRYVASKDELLAAMLDRAFLEFEWPQSAGGDWRQQLRELGRSFRALLLAHPALAALYFSELEAHSAVGLAIVETILALLERAGFPRDRAALLEASLERNVQALVMLEARAMSIGTPEERAERVRAQRARLLTLPPEQFPHVIAAADVLCGATDPGEAFEVSIDLMLAGLEKLLEDSPPAGRR